MKKTKTQIGITLIALIITIVVLLILAVVAINAVTGDGIIQHAVDAKEEQALAQAKEEAILAVNEWGIYKRTPEATTFFDFMNSKLGKIQDSKIQKVEDAGEGKVLITTKDGLQFEITETGVITVLDSEVEETPDPNPDPNPDLNPDDGSSTQITWSKISEGDLAIGSTVKTSTNEEFYVIGGDTVGTAITSSTQKIILLAKDNLKEDGSVQDTEGAINPYAFCTETAWNEASVAANDDLNTKATIKADTTSVVSKAIEYGETLGATGRLMLKSEAEALKTANSDILYGKNGKSSGTYLNYWLGSASGTNERRVGCVWSLQLLRRRRLRRRHQLRGASSSRSLKV